MAPFLNIKEMRIELMRNYLRGETELGAPSNFMGSKVDKLKTFRPRNLLLGACLHSAGRRTNGMSVTGAGSRMLDMLSSIGADGDEIEQYGQMYTEFHDSGANSHVQILPDSVACQELEKEYGDREFLRDVKALTKEIVAMKGNHIVDISKMSKDNGDNEEPNENAFGVTVFTGPEVLTTDSDATLLNRDGCKLVLTKFKVHSTPTAKRRETNWLTAVGSDIERVPLPDGCMRLAAESKRSEIFKDTTAGQVLKFNDQVLYAGKVKKHLACHVMCWEADDSSDDFYTGVLETLYAGAKELIEAALADASADASWDSNEALLAIVATVTSFVNVLLDLLSRGPEDVFRSERTIAFTAEGLIALQNRPSNEVALYFDINSDRGPSRDELFIKRTANFGPPGTLHYTIFNGTSWTFPEPAGNDMVSPNGMSVADSEGTVLGVGHAPDCSMRYSFLKDGKWSPAESVQSKQMSRNLPSVVSFKGKFICVYRGMGDEIWCTSGDASPVVAPTAPSPYSPLTNPLTMLYKPSVWSDPIRAGNESLTADAPAVVAFNDRLICVVRGKNNQIYWNESGDGAQWNSRYNALVSGALTSGSPSLAVLNNELYVCIRGMDNCLYWNKMNSSWSSRWTREGDFTMSSSPALASVGHQIVCTFRDASDLLNFLTFDGSNWSAPKLVGVQNSQPGEQGLCVLDSKLHCFFGAA